jgi:hypothetical protein
MDSFQWPNNSYPPFDPSPPANQHPLQMPICNEAEVPNIDPELDPSASPTIPEDAADHLLRLHSVEPVSSGTQEDSADSPSGPGSGSVFLTSMPPPAKPARKPKAPTLKEKDWDPHKSKLEELHVKKKMQLDKIVEHMREELGFNAT